MNLKQIQDALMQSLAAMGCPCRLHDTPESLQLDSLDVVELCIEIDDRTKLDIKDEWLTPDMQTMSFDDISRRIFEKVKEKP